MRMLLLSASLLVACLAGLGARAETSPIVVELFTSQSCSSCPAADRALRELARKNEHILALSCHVTYWDHLSWKDTLSREDCTQRQRKYAAQLGNRSRIYTPQMVVNGSAEFVGSDESKAKAAIRDTHRVRRIELTRSPDGESVRAQLPELEVSDVRGTLKTNGYKLQIFGYKRRHEESVKRGENRGKDLSYTNSVIYRGALVSWNGRARERSFDIPTPSMDGITLLAQSIESGAVLAAGNVEFDRAR